MSIPNFKLSLLSTLALLMLASVCNAQLVTSPSASAAAVPAPTAASAAAAVTNTFPISSISAASAAEIQKINENMTVLSARLAQLELQSKIAVKQKEITGLGGVTNFSPLGSATGAPSVVSVAGLKGHLEALLVFPGGVVQRVKAGDVIGDRKVSKVSINEVVLTDLKGSNLQRLAFGTAAVTREANTSSSSPMPLPPGGGPSATFNR